MPAKSWTTQEVARAVEMRQQGHKIATVARALDRPYTAVARKLCKVGAVTRTPKRKPGSLAVSIRRMARPGVSDRDIAAKLRISFELVYRVRKRLGIPAGLSPSDAWTRRKPKRSPLPECWHCGRKSKRCAFGVTLESQGWWTRALPGLDARESYCPECVHQHGTPDEWGAPASLSAPKPTPSFPHVPRVYTLTNGV